ncbi:MAG: SMC-Scp complex subunit ScpB [Gemmatimonadota bacterium]|nr:SMC-Scp complex subunit ScpB [Gemmatimonadota bacterium]MDE3006630.1 SMC-Scp complex subunit ScpB [Gemmatimonadota bacterium]MDE3014520.1 SMC-Scp complex subunit ScpB [Gemmatimonadota bacterium]
MNAHQIVEAVLFASDAPLTADEIARADEMLDEDQVEEALRFLRAEYDDAARAFQLHELAEGYQILTRPEYAPYLERFDNVPKSSRLSGPALETLAIIAYRQPIGRLEVEYIRGVNASGVIRTLQDRRLIDVVGRAEGLGRPLLYGTTRFFLEHFGFGSLEDLPRPEELPVVLRERVPLGSEQAAVEQVEGADEADAASGEAGEASETSEESEAGMEQEASEAYAGLDSESTIALGVESAEESETESKADGEGDGHQEPQDEPERES